MNPRSNANMSIAIVKLLSTISSLRACIHKTSNIISSLGKNKGYFEYLSTFHITIYVPRKTVILLKHFGDRIVISPKYFGHNRACNIVYLSNIFPKTKFVNKFGELKVTNINKFIIVLMQ